MSIDTQMNHFKKHISLKNLEKQLLVLMIPLPPTSRLHSTPWTAQYALDLLFLAQGPETKGPYGRLPGQHGFHLVCFWYNSNKESPATTHTPPAPTSQESDPVCLPVLAAFFWACDTPQSPGMLKLLFLLATAAAWQEQNRDQSNELVILKVRGDPFLR